MQIFAFHLELGMRQIAHPQEQVARRAARRGVALAGQTQLGSFTDAGGHVDLQGLGPLRHLQGHGAAAAA